MSQRVVLPEVAVRVVAVIRYAGGGFAFKAVLPVGIAVALGNAR